MKMILELDYKVIKKDTPPMTHEQICKAFASYLTTTTFDLCPMIGGQTKIIFEEVKYG